MDATTAASTIAGPIGNLAANFYFSPQSTARGEAIGLDVISLYGAGRASMLGGVEPETADSVVYFFKPGAFPPRKNNNRVRSGSGLELLVSYISRSDPISPPTATLAHPLKRRIA